MKRFKDYLCGAASIFDFSGSLIELPDQTDAEALAGDWRAVGRDLDEVLSGLGGEAQEPRDTD